MKILLQNVTVIFWFVNSNENNLFIYSWQEGRKTNGFWLELFIEQVPAVSDRLFTM